jgi:hypothetical protein
MCDAKFCGQDVDFHLTRANVYGLLIRRPREADRGYFYLVETVREHGRAKQHDVRHADRLQEVARSATGGT